MVVYKDIVVDAPFDVLVELFVILNGFCMKNQIVELHTQNFSILLRDAQTLVIRFKNKETIITAATKLEFWIKLKSFTTILDKHITAQVLADKLDFEIRKLLQSAQISKRAVTMMPVDDIMESEEEEQKIQEKAKQVSSVTEAFVTGHYDGVSSDQIKKFLEDMSRTLLDKHPDNIEGGGALAMQIKSAYEETDRVSLVSKMNAIYRLCRNQGLLEEVLKPYLHSESPDDPRL